MGRVTRVLVTMLFGAMICSAAKASTEIERLAVDFDAAWATAGGPAPPLGIAFISLTEDERSMLGIVDGRGVRLLTVDSGSLGERLGLKENDIVVGLNGSPVYSAEQFLELVRSRDSTTTPYFERFTNATASASMTGVQAANDGASQSDSTPIDCGPNPTLECAMRMLRDSWSKLREAVK